MSTRIRNSGFWLVWLQSYAKYFLFSGSCQIRIQGWPFHFSFIEGAQIQQKYGLKISVVVREILFNNKHCTLEDIGTFYFTRISIQSVLFFCNCKWNWLIITLSPYRDIYSVFRSFPCHHLPFHLHLNFSILVPSKYLPYDFW